MNSSKLITYPLTTPKSNYCFRSCGISTPFDDCEKSWIDRRLQTDDDDLHMLSPTLSQCKFMLDRGEICLVTSSVQCYTWRELCREVSTSNVNGQSQQGLINLVRTFQSLSIGPKTPRSRPETLVNAHHSWLSSEIHMSISWIARP